MLLVFQKLTNSAFSKQARSRQGSDDFLMASFSAGKEKCLVHQIAKFKIWQSEFIFQTIILKLDICFFDTQNVNDCSIDALNYTKILYTDH